MAKRALISVYDKTGLEELARAFYVIGIEILSTGGTLDFLKSCGIPAVSISDVTNFPEILDGRVKTLNPIIHGGILGRRELKSHNDEMRMYGIQTIDIVVCNLYPFSKIVQDENVPLQVALENIDIGGPAMIRAAAKNFLNVIVVVSQGDYKAVAKALTYSSVSNDMRRDLAAKAFKTVSDYDANITGYLYRSKDQVPSGSGLSSTFWKSGPPLRYGENPHQRAQIFTPFHEEGGTANAKLLHGVPMSYLNYLDADAAWKTVTAFDKHSCTIVKHTNPCGLAIRAEQASAYEAALAGDPVSAFGGIVGFNTPVEQKTADIMSNTFFDVIVAPSYHPQALEILNKRKRTRILQVKQTTLTSNLYLRSIAGGVLIQEQDSVGSFVFEWEVKTKLKPSPTQLNDLQFAWRACRFVKSNAIVFAKNRALVGMGAGQPNRVTSVLLAAKVAGKNAKGAVLASDAFFSLP